MEEEKVSLLIPIYNERKYIVDLIKSILNFTYDNSKIEVIFVDGGSTDGTIEIIKNYNNDINNLYILDNKLKTVPYALNLGLKHSNGKYIIRLDAHAKYPSDYISKLIYYSKSLNADNVGGICITEPKNKNSKSLAIKYVLSSSIGVGNSFFRTGKYKGIKKVDTVPFGCYRRSIFNKIGNFDERLERNQDIEFNSRLKKNGGNIFLVSDIKLIYYSKETFKELFVSSFNNGLWNINTYKYTKNINTLSLRHYIPLLFVIISIMLAIFSAFNSLLYMTPILIYIIIIIIESVRIDNASFRKVIYAIISFIVLHYSYGLGSIIGLIKLCKVNK